MDSLRGQVAVVTGASRGCGQGIALALGERGGDGVRDRPERPRAADDAGPAPAREHPGRNATRLARMLPVLR